MNRPNCAIVIPVYLPQLNPYEEISLRQCGRLFKDYSIVITGPTQLNPCYYKNILKGAEWAPFPARHFISLDAYSRFLLEPEFYYRFTDYDYILIYQPDAFMFRDELAHWCSMEYDYIGAPFPNPELKDLHLIGSWTGRNGGLSLRRVSAHLEVLLNYRHVRRRSLRELLILYHQENKDYSLRNITTFFREHMGIRNTMGHLIDSYDLYEDVFWSMEAPRTKAFRIPDPLTAARFAVETKPRFWSDRLFGDLPAGCHAWFKYDLAFWQPHLEKCGYRLPPQSHGSLLRSA
jgi:hypothetical protein